MNNNLNNNKFNPDVVNNYKKLLESRNNQNFQINNIPYKPITKTNIPNNIKSAKDLQIKTDATNIDIKNKLNELSKKRQYDDSLEKQKFNSENKNKFEQEFKYRNIEIHKISTSGKDNNNYNNLKQDTNSYYEIQKKKLNQDKERYNDIINSILKDGLLN